MTGTAGDQPSPLAALYLRKLPRHPAREAVRAGYGGPVYGTGWTIVVALLAAFGIAVIATPAGISGAVLLLPFQVSVLGTPSPAVTPTNLLYNVVATPGALYRYRRQHQTGGRMALLVHAAAAVACYKGDLLPGGYDEWLLDARSELDRQCADVCDLLGAARTRAGDLPGAVQAVRRRIQLQPLEEIGYRTLMLRQADLGDRAGAVSTYHHCASVLERELGVIPDPVTRQAFQRLIADGGPDGARRPARPRCTSPGGPGR